jgi:hypothetical protein
MKLSFIVLLFFVLHVAICGESKKRYYFDLLIDNIKSHNNNYPLSKANGNSNTYIYNIHINQDFRYIERYSLFSHVYTSYNKTQLISQMFILSYIFSPSDHIFYLNNLPFEIISFTPHGYHNNKIGQNNQNNYYGDFQIKINKDCNNLLQYIDICMEKTTFRNFFFCRALFTATFYKNFYSDDYCAYCNGNYYFFSDKNNKFNNKKNIFYSELKM